jgi:hypothetical protein
MTPKHDVDVIAILKAKIWADAAKPRDMGPLKYSCPSCGANVNQACQRSRRGLNRTISQATPCAERSAKWVRETFPTRTKPLAANKPRG